MGLFSKRAPEPVTYPITDFWRWWAETGHRISPHEPSAMTDELSRRVAAIHPDLTWHFGAGTRAQHRLTVSAGGIAALRSSAERWFRAAPAVDGTWEFSPSQLADPDALVNSLEIAGSRFDLAQTSFQVEPVDEEARVHVGVHHPLFEQVPTEVQLQVTFLLLDWLLGEDTVERWLGSIDALTVAPVPGATGDQVRTAVADMAARRDPSTWTIAQWADAKGRPGLASFPSGLRWLDHPTFDTHQIVTVGYRAQANGFPGDPGDLDRLGEVQEQLENLLGIRGVLVGYETHRGARTFHAYTDGEDQNVGSSLKDWAKAAGHSYRSGADPGWTEVRHFTG